MVFRVEHPHNLLIEQASISREHLVSIFHNRIPLLLTIMVCALGVGLPLFWDLPGHWRLLGAMQNSGHTVLFFAMSFCLVWRGLKGWWVFLALLSVGIGIEITQYFIGKDCDIHDVFLDTLGIVSGIVFYSGLQKKSLPIVFLAALLAALAFYIPLLISLCYLTQWRSFPTLATFDEPGRNQLVDRHEGASFAFTAAPKDWIDNHSQVLRMDCPIEGWPGVALVDLAPDWRNFAELQLDIWLPGELPITLGIAIRAIGNKSDHHDISRHFALRPGLNHVSWPLEDMAQKATSGPILLAKIGKVIIFCMPEDTRKNSSSVYIDNVVLLPSR